MSPPLQLRHLDFDGTGVSYGVVAPAVSPLATLVWLHGLGGASTVQFSPFAMRPELAEITSILIDLPGFGQSAATAGVATLDEAATLVERIVQIVAEPPVVLFGHSMGGSIAILAAASLGPRLAKLVVAEPNRMAGDGAFSRRIAAMPEDAWLDRGYHALVRAIQLEARSTPSTATFLRCLEMASPLAMHRAARSLVTPRTPSIGEVFDRLAVPRASIAGAASNPGSRTAGVPAFVVPAAGHIMMAGNPDGFVTALVGAIGPLVPPRTC